MRLNVYGNMPIMTPRDPQVPMEAANKNYVDNSINFHASDYSLHLTAAQNTLLDNLTVTSTEINSLSGISSNVQTQLDGKLSLTGGVLSGFLTLNDSPVNMLHAATKQYVDTADALKVNKAGDTMTGSLTLNGDPTSALHATPKQYVDSSIATHANDETKHLTASQNTLLDGITVTYTEVNQLSGVTSNVQAQVDSKVAKSGDVMTGSLTLSGDPTANLHAATKQYVDTKDGLKVSKSGDTMTGALVLPGNPVADLEAAPKQYVDASITTHTGDTSVHLTAAQNTLLDAVTVSAGEINRLSGVTSNVQTQIDSKVSKAGDTMTGTLTLHADPVNALEAATKQYTDNQDALKVAKAGDTMTGSLTLNGDPTANLHAAPKQYVDATMATHAADETKHLTAAQNTLIDGITVSSTEINRLTGVSGDIQVQIDTKFDKAGGLITGDVTLDAGKTVFVSKVPSASNELVNKAYVDSIANGQKWKDPVTDVNLISDNLSTPPASPEKDDVYIIGSNPTGAWAGKPGYATFFNGTSWVFLQARAVQVGDRFGVKFTTATAPTGGVATYAGKIVTITSQTPGAITYSVGTDGASSTTLVYDPDSSKFGVSYTLNDEGSWIPTNTSVNLSPGDGLSLIGNLLNVNPGSGIGIVNDTVSAKLDNVAGLDTNESNQITLLKDGNTLVSSALGIKINDTVIADINDRLSKTATSTVTGDVTFSSTASLKTDFTPTSNSQVVNKGYVDAADNYIQGEIDVITGYVNTLRADPVTKQYVDTQDATKVAKAGDTMTGALVLAGDPTSDLDAAPKQYVDFLIDSHSADDYVHLTPAQNTLLDAITVSAPEINRLTGVTSNVQVQIDEKVAKAGDTMTGALVLAADPVNALEATTKQYTDAADATKVAKAGDTMTGSLTLNADPTSALHAATKQYVDSGITTHTGDTSVHLTAAQNTLLDGLTVTSTEINRLTGVTSNVQTQLDSKLDLAGGTMQGALVLDADPIADLEAATKQYVDTKDALKVNKAGDTMTGALVLPADPTSALQATTKQYVDVNLASHANDDSKHITAAQNTFLDAITVSATEVNELAGIDGNVQLQLDNKLNLSGGTLTGFLTLNADPTANLQAATKQYVDTNDGLKVSKAGDTMTGALVLPADPVNPLEAAPKQYVDSSISTLTTYVDTKDATKVSKAGDTMTGTLTLHADPVNALEASTKQYVDNKIDITKTYIDTKDGELQTQITALQGTVSTLNADPVTKLYVDAADATKVAKAGDTMTGYLVLHADPQQNMHPATKQYVDAVAQGLVTKPSVRLATVDNLDAAYNNGSFGVNSTLTGNANGALVVDGKTPAVGDRILVKEQTNKAHNGDFVVQQLGDVNTPFILKRISTIDESSEVPGSYFYVYDGNTLKGTGWVFTVDNPVTFTIGTDNINVNQFSGQGSLIAGAGLTMNGNTIDINTANPSRIVVTADAIDLATTGVAPGSYTKVTVDGYGRVTTASNPNTLAGYGITDGQQLNANLTSLSAVATYGVLVRDNTNTIITKAIDVNGIGLTVTNKDGAASGNVEITSNATSSSTADTIVSRDSSGNFSANIITAALNGNANTATTLATSRNFSITGDVVASAIGFNGSANVELTTTLTDTGVTAGNYTHVTVDAKGRVTAGSNPDTAAGLGITDVYDKATVDAMLAAMEAKYEELYLYVMSRI